jgi:hypothetical protein
VTRRLSILLAALALVASSFGMAATVAAATPNAVDDPSVVVQRSAGPTAIDVLANDTVASGATITAHTAAAHGDVVLAGDGLSLTYDPDQGYAGSDTFDYTISDPDEPPETATDTATVTIKVNAPPVAVDNPSTACDVADSSAFGLHEDMAEYTAGGSCNLLANDTDSDGTVVDWEIVTPPDHGQVTNEIPLDVPGLSSDFAYVPDDDYFTKAGNLPGGAWLSDSFTYRAIDDDGARSEPATVRFWIGPVNDAPTFTAGSSTISSPHDTSYSQPWASAISPGPANESDQIVHFQPDLPFTVPPGLFTVAPSISATGRLTFTPAPGQSGTANVTFVAKDNGGLEQYGGGAGGPAAEDTSDPVTFAITITANEAPVAVNDPAVPGCITNEFGGAFPVPEDGAQVVLTGSCSPRINDSDSDGTIESWQVDTEPAHGDLEWLPNQPDSFGYTPAANYFTAPGTWTSDSFTYHVVDNDGTSSNTATYRFWIAPVNDAPTFTVGPAVVDGAPGVPFSGGWASAVSAGPNESSQTVHFERTGLDLHGNTGLFGVAPVMAANGTLSFTAAAGHTGTATVMFVAKDNGGLEHYDGIPDTADDTSDAVTFDITITEGPQAPDANDDQRTIAEDAGATAMNVRVNDTDANADPLTITTVTQGTKGAVAITGGGTGLTYAPAANLNGADAFTYTISDGNGGTDTATVDVTITPVNDAPVATSNAATVAEDQTSKTTVLVLANDTDIDGDALIVSSKTNGAKGAVEIATDQKSVTYQPNAQAFGSDSFSYTVSDGHGGSASATVTVTITALNDAPNAVNDGVPTPFKVALGGAAKAIPVLANDTWLPDAPETLRIVGRTNGSHGTVAITGGGTGLTYRPTGSATGIDLFTYTINDGHGGTDTASVQVTVVDTTAPTAAIVTIQKSTIPGRSGLRVYVKWSITETGSGVKSQLFQRRTDSGRWVTVALASSTTRAVAFGLPRGHLYTFRVRATDRAGNVGIFASRAIRI